MCKSNLGKRKLALRRDPY
uniref:Uncharacterized protein n=1 Tax=Anguilla anguilla TaxID=7936 RepID=A0A0E9QF10_ANGAN